MINIKFTAAFLSAFPITIVLSHMIPTEKKAISEHKTDGLCTVLWNSILWLSQIDYNPGLEVVFLY